jgi:ribosome-binding factor A
MNFRIDRLNGEMQRSISEIIEHRIKDPRVTELVSVTSVNVAEDLKTAKVYLSIFGQQDKVKLTYETICKCAGFIRSELAKEFRDLRCVPELRFLMDTSMEYSKKIENILDTINKNERN